MPMILWVSEQNAEMCDGSLKTSIYVSAMSLLVLENLRPFMFVQLILEIRPSRLVTAGSTWREGNNVEALDAGWSRRTWRFDFDIQ